MALLAIPVVPSRRSSSRRVKLSGREYRLDLTWSDFEGRFYLALFSAAGVVLVPGVPVVSGQPLLDGRHSVSGVPEGELVALDVRRESADPGLEDLGEIIRLTYWPPASSTSGSTTITGSGGGGGEEV